MARRIDTRLLTNALVDETSGAATCLSSAIQHAIRVKWSLGTTSGVVEIESGPDKDYAGTWAPLATITWATANSVDEWRGAGAFAALRARISTVIAGGTGVTVDYSQVTA